MNPDFLILSAEVDVVTKKSERFKVKRFENGEHFLLRKKESISISRKQKMLAGGASFENLHAIISSKLVRGQSFKKKDVTLLKRKWDSSSVAITLT